MKETTVAIRPYTTGELAALYNIGVKTFRNWLVPFKEEIGPKRSHFYNVTQVRVIFKRLGIPGSVSEEEL